MFRTLLECAAYLALWFVVLFTGYTAMHAVGWGYSGITGWRLLLPEVSAVLVGCGFLFVGVMDFLDPDAWDDDESGYEPSPFGNLFCGLACIVIAASLRVWQIPYEVTVVCAILTVIAAVRVILFIDEQRV
jgi:hypothetical protein